MAVQAGPLVQADLDQVVLIEQANFATPWSRVLFEEELKRPDICHWLAFKDGGALLAYGGFWKAVDEAHFTNVAVRQDRQRQGLGRRLVLALLSLAREKGCVRATLEVRPSNLAALKLYESLGFQAAAMRPKYYSDNGEDALILWLPQIKDAHA